VRFPILNPNIPSLLWSVGIFIAALDPELPKQEGMYFTDMNLTMEPIKLKPYAVDQENEERL
jgi:hypothetical protein